jgi:hypothetical protein
MLRKDIIIQKWFGDDFWKKGLSIYTEKKQRKEVIV